MTAAKQPPPKRTRASARGGKVKPSPIDWVALRRDYRTGKFTYQELATKYGINMSTLANRAKREGWTKDLADLVRHATDAALLRDAVERAKDKAVGKLRDLLAGEAGADAESVAAAAELNRSVIEGHRTQLAELREIAQGQARELAAIGSVKARFDDTAIATAAGSVGMTATELGDMLEAATLTNRIGLLDKLSSAAAKLLPLERKAHNLDRAGEEGDFSFDSWMRQNPALRARLAPPEATE